MEIDGRDQISNSPKSSRTLVTLAIIPVNGFSPVMSLTVNSFPKSQKTELMTSQVYIMELA